MITFRKEWTLDPVTQDQATTLLAGPLPDELKAVSPEQMPYATRLLRLIRFRYIPNHVHPSQILRDEQTTYASSCLTDLGSSNCFQTRA